ncbi:MAG: excinuclease ABC subunit UvrA, partial [Fidelibacterota bacterium]
MEDGVLFIKGAKEHNLKNIDVSIPRNRFVVITGLSGSGKSSLAFDTIYAEGQRRYVESLSAYARQFLGLMEKPDVEYIEGLSPAISIEQRTSAKNPRSTVGTVTEIYDYLRLLFARVGIPYCYKCGKKIQRQTVQQIVDSILNLPEGTKIQILAPVVRGRKGEYRDTFREIQKEGYVRVRVDGKIMEVSRKIKLDKKKKHNIEVVVDRLVVHGSIGERLSDSLETALKLASGVVTVNRIGGEDIIFSEHFACPDCEISYEELSPRMFSFNSPYGACRRCGGLGSQIEINPDLVVPDQTRSLSQGCIVPIGEQPRGNWYSIMLKGLAAHYGFDFVTPFYKLPPKVQEVLLYGSGNERILIKYRYYDGRGSGEFYSTFEGVIPNLRRRYTQTRSSGIRTWIEKFMSVTPCPECGGARLRKESLAVRVSGYSIKDVVRMSIKEARDFFNDIKLTKGEEEIARQILKEIRERLQFMINVGLDYLTLDRSAGTLSGGEAQRIRLATQIGSQLVGVLYILDEPSIGLHQRDNKRLIKTIEHLKNLGNTVLVVEHDRETIESADYVIDLGPGAGERGGWVVAVGTPDDIKRAENSITGQYLSGIKSIPVPFRRRVLNKRSLIIKGAEGHNLKKID